MRTFLSLCLLALALLVLALIGAVASALSDAPSVQPPPAWSPAHVARARQLLLRNDPRRLPSGVPRTLVLSEADLDLALNHLADRHRGARARLVLQPGEAEIAASLPVPASPLGGYLNLSLRLRDGEGLPTVEHLRLGRLPVPGWMVQPLVAWAVRQALTPEGLSATGDTIEQLRFGDRKLLVRYVWQDDLPQRLRAGLMSPQELARLRAHQEALAARDAALPQGRAAALDTLIGPAFAFAAQRSADGDPVAENRAALLVLAFHANGRGLEVVAPAARDWPRPRVRPVTLAARTDLAKHFMVSAAIAAHAGAPLADAIGLYKELEDAQGGSGFSFDDLAADRAGTRLGERAVADAASALALQQRLAAGVDGAALLPKVSDLPSGMAAGVFQQRYGGVGTPAYQRELDRIEARIEALPLYR